MALNKIYTVTEGNGIYVSTDGAIFNSIPDATLVNRNSVMSQPGNNNTVIVVGDPQIVNDFPEILYSDNSGTLWSIPGGNWNTTPGVWGLPAGTQSAYSIFWLSPTTCFIGGANGTVIRSVDSGLTFNLMNKPETAPAVPDTGNVNAIHFNTLAIGYITCGTNIYQTIDGGVTWIYLNGGIPLALAGVSENRGIFVDNTGQFITVLCGPGIARSTDFGVTFPTAYTTAFAINLRRMRFRTATQGWAIGDTNRRLITNDGGASWTLLAPVGPASVNYAIHFYSLLNGFYSNDNNLLRSIDGGVNGIVVFTPVEGDIRDIWIDGVPVPTFNLTPCDPGCGADILCAIEGPGVDLVSNIGNVIKFDGSVCCYTVSAGIEDCTPTYTVLVIDSVIGPDCVPFTATLTTPFPTTFVGDTSNAQISVVNNSATAQNFSFSIGSCSLEISATTIPPINILAGGTGFIDLEYTPTLGQNGACLITVTSECGSILVPVPFLGIEIPECPHFQISITGPSCAPDCIQPGTAIVFDLGGTITPSVYPTEVFFSIINDIDNTVYFSTSYIVNNDAELDAIQVTVVAPLPGQYHAEVCLPGCNSKRILSFTVCEPFDIYKDECRKYHVHRPWNDNRSEYLVNVTALEGDTVVADVLWNSNEEPIFNFEVPGDGIYIFYMKDPETGDILYTFAVFENCDLLSCWQSLMEKIMCSCSDPCCKKCSGTAQKEMEYARVTLNKLVPLFLTYFGIAKQWELDSMGMNLISPDQMCFLFKANQLLTKIQELTASCGCKCNEDLSTASSRGDCLSC